MLWKTLSPITSDEGEPPELRELKYQLANVICKCRICIGESLSNQNYLEKGIQVEQKVFSIDRLVQATSSSMCPEQCIYLGKDLCPSCFVMRKLLRGGVIKLMKDEESETKREMFTCDKGTRKAVKYAEKTTSFTDSPIPVYSKVTLRDFISKYSSESSEVGKKGSKREERIKFINITENKNPLPIPTYEESFCLENFMDSIRPLLINM